MVRFTIILLLAFPSFAFAQRKPGDGFSIGGGISLCILKEVASPRECHRIDEQSDLSPIPDWAFWPQENYQMISDIGQGKFGDLLDKLRDIAEGKAWDYVEAWATGDPHVVSFGSDAFDFMARGEFTYTELGEGAQYFRVDAQHRSVGGDAAFIEAVSVGIGTHVVEIQSRRKQVVINGQKVRIKRKGIYLLHAQELSAPSNNSETPYAEIEGAILVHKNSYILISKDLHFVVIEHWPSNLDLYVMLNTDNIDRPSDVTGVLGSALGSLRFATGDQIPDSLSREQFITFAEGFQVAIGDSQFTSRRRIAFDSSFPNHFATIDELKEKSLNKATKQATKLVGKDANAIVRDACIYDLGFGGQKFKGSCKSNRSNPTRKITISE
ncbi:MAG: VWD domain-containing protein [Bdellovibrionales bacterium]|nr:VWD domain-containing protein [Bdellovibrionales bacterium]